MKTFQEMINETLTESKLNKNLIKLDDFTIKLLAQKINKQVITKASEREFLSYHINIDAIYLHSGVISKSGSIVVGGYVAYNYIDDDLDEDVYMFANYEYDISSNKVLRVDVDDMSESGEEYFKNVDKKITTQLKAVKI